MIEGVKTLNLAKKILQKTYQKFNDFTNELIREKANLTVLVSKFDTKGFHRVLQSHSEFTCSLGHK